MVSHPEVNRVNKLRSYLHDAFRETDFFFKVPCDFHVKNAANKNSLVTTGTSQRYCGFGSDHHDKVSHRNCWFPARMKVMFPLSSVIYTIALYQEDSVHILPSLKKTLYY